MNIQKFLAQDINKQLEKACIWGLRLHYLANDLRTFANEVGSKELNTLEQYHWFNQHFGPGFGAGPGYRSASNENYNNLGFCIRETQSNVLNTTEKKGNLGALNNNKIDPKSLVRFVMDLSLVVTVHNSERKDGGSNTNKNIAPFWRYANVGANVLQYTDDGFEDVTNCTINEINSNRWNRNKYFAEFRNRFEAIEPETIDQYRQEVYTSTYLKEPCSSTSPVLNEENLKLLVGNDPSAIATAFYPDKFKDRWKKAK